MMEHYDRAYDAMEIMDKLDMILESMEVLSVAVGLLAKANAEKNDTKQKPLFKIGANNAEDVEQNVIAKGFGNV